MKLAFTTLACPGWTLEQALDAAQRYGYEGIELRLLDGELLTPDLGADQRMRVLGACRSAGLPICCLDTSVRLAQPVRADRAAQVHDGIAFLELAAMWGAPCIRVFGGPPAGVGDDEAIEAATECLRPLAERGAELGVAVALETHDAFAAGASVARVLDQVPGPGAGALWDILHPNRVGEPVERTLELIGARLLHVHIKDGHRPPDGGPNWPLALLGEGDVPTASILRAMRGAGYDGWISVEWEKKWHPQIAEPEVALPQHADKLREYLAAMG
jgi:sugar phosphate isomerase/epimerase